MKKTSNMKVNEVDLLRETAMAQREFKTERGKRNISQLKEEYEKGEFIINNREFHEEDDNADLYLDQYNRDFVLNPVSASTLIESVLCDKVIPPLFFFHDIKANTTECIDGQHRLLGVFAFINNEFPLTDMSNRMRAHEGLYFDDLPETEQDDITSYIFDTVTYNGKSEIKYDVFKVMNANNKSLSKHELLVCEYPHSKGLILARKLRKSEDLNFLTELRKKGRADEDVISRLLYFVTNNKLQGGYKETAKMFAQTQYSDAELLSLEEDFLETLEMMRFIFNPIITAGEKCLSATEMQNMFYFVQSYKKIDKNAVLDNADVIRDILANEFKNKEEYFYIKFLQCRSGSNIARMLEYLTQLFTNKIEEKKSVA